MPSFLNLIIWINEKTDRHWWNLYTYITFALTFHFLANLCRLNFYVNIFFFFPTILEITNWWCYQNLDEINTDPWMESTQCIINLNYFLFLKWFLFFPLYCSVNFLLYSKVTQSHTHTYTFLFLTLRCSIISD